MNELEELRAMGIALRSQAEAVIRLTTALIQRAQMAEEEPDPDAAPELPDVFTGGQK